MVPFAPEYFMNNEIAGTSNEYPVMILIDDIRGITRIHPKRLHSELAVNTISRVHGSNDLPEKHAAKASSLRGNSGIPTKHGANIAHQSVQSRSAGRIDRFGDLHDTTLA